MEKFKNILKDIIWKHFETYGEIWKHFETHNYWNLWGYLKTVL